MSSEKEGSDKTKTLPPRQRPVKRHLAWGENHPTIGGAVPRIDLKSYTLVIDGDVENPRKLGWTDILKLPKAESTGDFHCVEGWSVLDNHWEGIRFKTIVDIAKPRYNAKFATFECADGYTTSLSLEELSGDDVLLAYQLNGEPLNQRMGFPLRLVVPAKYAYKSAMWVTRIKFTVQKELGFWEMRGYSDTADVWKDDRFAR
jgi:DMSO/TMAO reductase YedYZ molybdopterin-dependent catalytic subunit